MKNQKAPDHKKVCKYYPYFCKRVGHHTASSKECAMHGKSKAEKDSALKSINDMLLASQITKVRSECECRTFHTSYEMFLDIFCLYCLYVFLFYWLNSKLNTFHMYNCF